MDTNDAKFGGVLRGLGLTKREAEITMRVVRGQLDKEIASQLGISRSAVKEHERRAWEELGVTNRASLAATAMREYLRGGGVMVDMRLLPKRLLVRI